MSSNNKLKLLEVVTNKLNPPYKKEITALNSLDIPQDLIDKAKKYNINLRGLKEPLEIDSEEALQELPNSFITNLVSTIAKIDDKTLAFGGEDRIVTIVDISDKALPKVLGSIDSTNWVFSIAKIDDKTLAFGRRDRKVTIVDISDKALPKVLGSVDSGNSVLSIAKIDDETLAFGGEDRKVTIVDISDRAKPKEISTLLPLEALAYEVLSSDSWCFFNLNGWQINNDPLLYKYARLYEPKTKKLVPYYMLEKRLSFSDDKKEVCIKLKL